MPNFYTTVGGRRVPQGMMFQRPLTEEEAAVFSPDVEPYSPPPVPPASTGPVSGTKASAATKGTARQKVTFPDAPVYEPPPKPDFWDKLGADRGYKRDLNRWDLDRAARSQDFNNRLNMAIAASNQDYRNRPAWEGITHTNAITGKEEISVYDKNADVFEPTPLGGYVDENLTPGDIAVRYPERYAAMEAAEAARKLTELQTSHGYEMIQIGEKERQQARFGTSAGGGRGNTTWDAMLRTYEAQFGPGEGKRRLIEDQNLNRQMSGILRGMGMAMEQDPDNLMAPPQVNPRRAQEIIGGAREISAGRHAQPGGQPQTVEEFKSRFQAAQGRAPTVAEIQVWRRRVGLAGR